MAEVYLGRTAKDFYKLAINYQQNQTLDGQCLATHGLCTSIIVKTCIMKDAVHKSLTLAIDFDIALPWLTICICMAQQGLDCPLHSRLIYEVNATKILQ